MFFNKPLLLFVSSLLVVGFGILSVEAESQSFFSSKLIQNTANQNGSAPHTYFASKSFQNVVVQNGTGPPKSEKKMSAFSVEDFDG